MSSGAITSGSTRRFNFFQTHHIYNVHHKSYPPSLNRFVRESSITSSIPSDLNCELPIKLLIELNSNHTVLISPLLIPTLLLLTTLLAIRRALARLLRSKNLNSADTRVLGGVVEAASNLKHAVLVRELDLGSGFLLDAVTVVEIQLTAGLAVTIRGDDEVEGLGADFGGGEGAFGAERDDGAAADVEGDLGEVNVFKLDLGAFAFNDFPGIESVEAVVGEVDGDAGAVLFGDGRDEDVGAV